MVLVEASNRARERLPLMGQSWTPWCATMSSHAPSPRASTSTSKFQGMCDGQLPWSRPRIGRTRIATIAVA